jgi:UDP-N-acetylmuramoylalanine--D-glutamate ligase
MMREPAFAMLKKPAATALRGKKLLVLGLGDTGLSVARWVERQGGKVRVADTRATPPGKAQFSGELHTGPFDAGLLAGVDLICVSPGLSLEEKIIREAFARDIPVVGDIELFAWQNTARVIAVTGTNGKSTVTALAGHLLRAGGVDCEVAGNIGPPVLEALMKRKTAPAAWALELSSYQLETTWSLAPAAAAMLNLTEDHFDRYASLDEYAAAKARIFMGGGLQVLNRDDRASVGMTVPDREHCTFGLGVPPRLQDFGVAGQDLLQGKNRILGIDELAIRGSHNVANALAACALVSIFKLPPEALRAGLKTFTGLPHRLQLIATRRGVEWYDDSKGTNVGATVAALRGLGRKTVLILGGEGKGQDFSPLRDPVCRYCMKVLLIGRDAPLIAKVIPGENCDSLEEAVQRASEIAKAGEAVLLSPACASFDMFRDYRHRGEVFAQAVKRLGP